MNINLRKSIEKAKKLHDAEFMNIDWDADMYKLPPKTNEVTYFPNKNKQDQENMRAYKAQVINSQYSNILPSFTAIDNINHNHYKPSVIVNQHLSRCRAFI